MQDTIDIAKIHADATFIHDQLDRVLESKRELVSVLREALDSRAPDYANAQHPGWGLRAALALANAEALP